ncbi:MAG: 3-phosphoglycerate dehydrogenase [Phycisphaerae bacterium]|nr:3-phosphoglycerate dehydrogenase [Phycisphaerae bacterium]
MHKILLAKTLASDAERRLEAAATVVRAPAEDEQTLSGLIGDCEALIACTSTPVTRALLEAGRKLRVVGVAGVGLEQVDLAAAEELGIAVLHTPAAATVAVADLTVAFMLQLLRPIPRLAAEYRLGRYQPARAEPHGDELGEMTIGIVGLGRIGAQVGRRCAAGFGARVLYNDIVEVGPFDFPAEPVDKPTIWSESDIVTLHVPLTEQTRGLVDAEVLSRLRPKALLINTSRGAVVDTAALTAALQAGRLGGAALDVVEPEPLPATHPLFTCERCILTPHVASRTHGGMRRMCAVVDEVLTFLERGDDFSA